MAGRILDAWSASEGCHQLCLSLIQMLIEEFSQQWCHNERDSVSNHRHFDCLINSLFRRKQQSSESLAFVREIHRSPVDPLTKGQLRENVSVWWRHHDSFANALWVHQVEVDVRFSNVDKFSKVYKSSNGAYLNLATVLGPQNIVFEAL